MPTQSKRFKALAVKNPTPAKNPLPIDQAVVMLKEFANTKFDQSIEIAVRLGIDPKQADQLVRGSLVLPHGIGKSLRVVVFAKGVFDSWPAALPLAGTTGEFRSGSRRYVWLEFGRAAPEPPAIPTRDESR